MRRGWLFPGGSSLETGGTGNDGSGNLSPFDFAIIRYKWTSESGDDLDTRTAVLGTGSVYDGAEVGYGRQYYVGPASPYYLTWGEDNQGSGVEAVLIDFKRLSLDFPAASTFDVRLRAHWYVNRRSGNITLEFATYLGGAMQQSGYDFINVGGAAVQVIDDPRDVTFLNDYSANIGQELGILRYNVAGKTAVILQP